MQTGVRIRWGAFSGSDPDLVPIFLTLGYISGCFYLEGRIRVNSTQIRRHVLIYPQYILITYFNFVHIFEISPDPATII